MRVFAVILSTKTIKGWAWLRARMRNADSTISGEHQNQNPFDDGEKSRQSMARDADVTRELVDLQADVDDFFIRQERRLREGGWH